MKSPKKSNSSRFLYLTRFALILAFAFSFITGSLRPAWSFDDDNPMKDYFKQDTRNHWIIAPGISVGKTKMGKGYDGYGDLGNVGLDVYFTPPRPLYEQPTWRNKLFWRLSGEWFPLEVPEGVYGLTEDIYSFNNAIGFKSLSFTRPEEKQFVPFITAGFGLYWDRLKLDTPASGTKVGMHDFFGVNASAGAYFPSIGNLRLVPEVRWHGMRTTGNFWATHYTLQAALVLWIVPPKEQ